MGQDFMLIVGVTTLCMLSPGPDMVLVMHSTLTGDRREGLLTCCGVLSGNLVHIGYCALGLGYIIAHSVAVYASLKFAGAAYLMFLGLSGLRGVLHHDPDAPAAPHQRRARSAYLRGLFNNLLNPKGALFYLGVFSQVITPNTPTPRAVALASTMVATSALFWLLFVYTLHQPAVRAWIAHSRRWINAAFGALLVALGLRVAAQD